MMASSGGLALMYVVVAAVTALLLVLGTNWRWQVKALLLVLVSVFYLVPYLSWPRLMGWPTVDDMPDEFNVLSMYVQPPNELLGSEGVIYLWVAERLAGGRQGIPRAYRFGYSVKQRQQILEMGEKLKKGVAQAGKKSKDADRGRPGRFDILGRLGRQKSSDLDFYDAPAPVLPDK